MVHQLLRRFRSRPAWVPIVLFLAVMLVGSACRCIPIPEATLPDDGPKIAVSMDSAKSFVEKVKAAGDTAESTKQLSLTVSQEELTSFVGIGTEMREKMQSLGIESHADLEQVQDAPELQAWLDVLEAGGEGFSPFGPASLVFRLGISEPQIYFKPNGQIVIRGYVEALGQRQPMRLVVAPQVSPEGELILEFVEGQVGPASVPKPLVDQVLGSAADAIRAADSNLQINNVSVVNGMITIDGVLP